MRWKKWKILAQNSLKNTSTLRKICTNQWNFVETTCITSFLILLRKLPAKEWRFAIFKKTIRTSNSNFFERLRVASILIIPKQLLVNSLSISNTCFQRCLDADKCKPNRCELMVKVMSNLVCSLNNNCHIRQNKRKIYLFKFKMVILNIYMPYFSTKLANKSIMRATNRKVKSYKI